MTGRVEERRHRTLRVAGCFILPAALLAVAGCERGEDRGLRAAPRADAVPASPKDIGAPGDVSIAPGSPQLERIKLQPVVANDIPAEEVVAPGRVVINPNRTSRVLLPVAGRIVRVLVKLGDTVEQGQPVLAIESPEADGAIAASLQAEAGERQARAAVDKAEADHQRVKDLYEHQAAAQKEMVTAQNDLAQAKGGMETARAAREQARRKLELLGLKPTDFRQEILVRAPISGKVLEVNVAPGEYRNDTSTPLMTIADLSQVWIASEVPESAIRLIRVGDRVMITLVAYPDETFTGRVARIGDVLDAQSRTIRVYVEMANPGGRFRPEMFGSIRHSGAVRLLSVIPLTAIVYEYGRPMVFVERAPGRFERREVTLGTRRGDTVPVLAGLKAGERIIVEGSILLRGQ